MPKLKRCTEAENPGCQYCQLMKGTVYIEGEEPPAFPLSDYGVPGHKNCICYYLRMNCLTMQTTGGFILGEDGTALILAIETAERVFDPNAIPDRPEYVPPKTKKVYRAPYPFI
jgi:hypothetical protein